MRKQATLASVLAAAVVLAALAPDAAHAAGITFGARGGGGMSTFVGGDADGVDPGFNWSAGGFITISFANFEIQPEFLLSKKGASVSATETFDSGGDLIVVSREETDDLTYFEMPILIKKSGRTGYLFGGVSLGILLDGTYDLSYTQTRNGAPDGAGSDSGKIDGIDSFDLGLVVGGGARRRYMTVDARLSYGLQSIDSSRDVKNLVFSVMAGYHF